MLIWLGKQLLGQSDRQGIEHSGGREPVRIVEVTCDAELSRMTTEELQARLAQLQEQEVREAENTALLAAGQPHERP